jgi:hypothetical protein
LARAELDPDDRSVAEALARCAVPERRKQSCGGTVADVCLWAIASVSECRLCSFT